MYDKLRCHCRINFFPRGASLQFQTIACFFFDTQRCPSRVEGTQTWKANSFLRRILNFKRPAALCIKGGIFEEKVGGERDAVSPCTKCYKSSIKNGRRRRPPSPAISSRGWISLFWVMVWAWNPTKSHILLVYAYGQTPVGRKWVTFTWRKLIV